MNIKATRKFWKKNTSYQEAMLNGTSAKLDTSQGPDAYASSAGFI